MGVDFQKEQIEVLGMEVNCGVRHSHKMGFANDVRQMLKQNITSLIKF